MSRRDHYNRCPPCVTASLAAPALRRGYRSPAPRRSNSGGRSVCRPDAGGSRDRPAATSRAVAGDTAALRAPAGAGGGRASGRGSAGRSTRERRRRPAINNETFAGRDGTTHARTAGSSRADIRVNCFKNYRTTNRRPGSRARDASVLIRNGNLIIIHSMK